MCLLTKENLPKKAWEDIPVFKLVKVKKEIISSPWYEFVFELNKLYENEEEPKEDRYKTLQFIGNGYFHSFVTLEAAKRKMEEVQKYEPKTDFRIYKAIIPMGYQYYTGISDDYCSKALKVIEECMN